MSITPQKVENSSWKLWLKEAFVLVFRGPSLWVTILFAISFVSAPVPAEYYNFVRALISLPVLATLIICMQGVDKGEVSVGLCFAALKNIQAVLSIFIGISLVTAAISYAKALSAASGRLSIDYAYLWDLQGLLNNWAINQVEFSFSLFGLGLVFWFALPLCLFTSHDFSKCFRTGLVTMRLNIIPLGSVIGSLLLLVAVLDKINSLLAIPLIIYVPAVMYVSYRHIFLGQAENCPVRESICVEAVAPT